MCRHHRSFPVLQRKEDEGALVINSGYGVENCTRERLTRILIGSNIPTPESIMVNTDERVIDRMNKCYVADNYANLKGQTPIDFNFYNLQALFTNHLFLPGQQEISPKQYGRFELKQEGLAAEIRVKDVMGLLYTFLADGEEKILSTCIAEPSNRYALQWDYADFRLGDGQPFPMKMDVQVMKDGVSQGGITLHFSRMQTNVPVKMDSSVPSKYKRITLAQILKSLGSNKM